MTEHLPKPLLPVLGVPIISRTLRQARALGNVDVHVNLFHAASRLSENLVSGASGPVLCRTEPRLSGPAGALTLFLDRWSRYDVVLVLSGDVVFDADLRPLVSDHMASGAAMTFGAIRTTAARRFGVIEADGSGRVSRTVEKPSVPDHEEHLVSAGIYCLDPSVIAEIPQGVVYDYAAHLAPALIGKGMPVRVFELEGYWNDVGTPERLVQANLDLAEREHRRAPTFPGSTAEAVGPVHVGADVRIGDGTLIEGPAVIGPGAVIGSGCWISHAVVLPGAVVPDGSAIAGGLHGPLHHAVVGTP